MKQKNELKLPDLSQQSILHVNAVPDKEYPIRILRAYRENCNCKWSSTIGDNGKESPLLMEMNKLQDKRAEILDKAIEILERECNRKFK